MAKQTEQELEFIPDGLDFELEPPRHGSVSSLVTGIALDQETLLLDDEKETRDRALEQSLMLDEAGVGPESYESAKDIGFVESVRTKNKQDIAYHQDIGQAIKEIPQDLKVGGIGLVASAAEDLKRRGVQLSVLPMLFPELIDAFEPTDPKVEQERQALLDRDPAMRRLFLPHFGPGVGAAMANALLKGPGVAGSVFRSKQAKEAAKLPPVAFKDQPFTKLTRLVIQDGAPSVGASIGAGILTGSPLVALALLGETSGGAEFEEQLQAGSSPIKSSAVAELTGVIEIATEQLVIPRFITGVTKGMPLREAVNLIAENAGQEAIAGFSQTFISVWAKEREKGATVEEATQIAFVEGAKEVPRSAFVGAAIGGGVGGVGAVVGKVAGTDDKTVVTPEQLKEGVGPEPTDLPTIEEVEEESRDPKAKQMDIVEKIPDNVEEVLAGVAERKVAEAEPEADGEVVKEQSKPDLPILDSVEAVEVEAPIAGDVVDGRKVLPGVPNESSIEEDFEILPGIREISLEGWTGNSFVAADDIQRVKDLTEEIRTSNEVSPLIVAYDNTGPYIVEGVHRLDALVALGAKSFPAKVAVDISETGGVADVKTQPPTKPEPKPRKPVSKKTLAGLTKAEIALLPKKEQEKLRFAQIQGEKVGFKVGQRTSREQAKRSLSKLTNKLKTKKKLSEVNRKEARELVKTFITDKDDLDIRARLLDKIASVQEFTDKEAEAFVDRVSKGIAKADRRAAIGDLKKTVKSIKPKQMTTKLSDQAQEVLNKISLSTPTEETIARREELLGFAEDVLAVVPEDSVAFIEASQLKQRIEEIKARTINIRELETEDIEQITGALQGLAALDKQDKAIADVQRAKETDKRKKAIKAELNPKPPSKSAVTDWTKDFIGLKHGNLESLNDNINGGRFGTFKQWIDNESSLTQFVYDVLNDGTDSQAEQNQSAKDLTQEIVAKHKMDPIELHNEKKTFKLEDVNGKPRTFDFTVNEILSVYMHTRNSHNLAVLLRDGMDRTRVTVRGIETEIIRGFDRETVDNMIDSLTTEQKAFAREIGSRLMDGLNRNAINETSEVTEGRAIATVDNYWPAERNLLERLLGKTAVKVQSLLEGMGFLKERVGSGNPLVLRGFFETVNRTNKNVAAYHGMAEPLRMVKSVLTEDMALEFKKKGWEIEYRRMLEHVRRVEDNSPQIDPLSSFVGKMLGNFAKSRFGLNFKIAPRQYISVLLYSAYVDNIHLSAVRGKFDSSILKEISELSPQTGERLQSMRFDRDIGDAAIQDEFIDYFTGKSGVDAFMNAWSSGDLKQTMIAAEKLGLSGMKLFDTIAIVDGYRITKAEIAAERPDLKAGTDEYNALLKKRFEWLTRHTQPMWHVKDRSLLGSERNPFIRGLVMFSSQREQLVRMVANAAVAYENSGKTQTDLEAFGKAGGAVLFNVALFTLYGFAWAIGIQKREKEAKNLLPEFFQNLVGNLFFTKAVVEAMRNVQARNEGRLTRVNLDTATTSLTRNAVGALLTYQKAAEHFAVRDSRAGVYQSGPNKGKEKWAIEIQVATDQLADVVSGVTGLPYVGPKDVLRLLKPSENKKRSVDLGAR
jgi:hypothetical protein